MTKGQVAVALAGFLLPAGAGVVPQGEMRLRLERNFDRLEEEKYRPENVFLDMKASQGWPGDTEGRTILALVSDARATGREPRYLTEILRRLPSRLNARGYMGPDVSPRMNEQQVSGNGWMLRGLCEFYLWKRKPETLGLIRRLAEGLFLPAKGRFADYPIDPASRRKGVGGASGSTVASTGDWDLSSDVGCFMIGIDGLVQARIVLDDPRFDAVIDEAIMRFLQIDLVAIKAQTHATLTGLRALLRYADCKSGTEANRLVAEAARRFELYTRYGMTENFENYNWFGRYDTWTEPCAIVDSYLVALQLWGRTGRTDYLEWADRIWWNGICRTQRKNGGFGLDTCPGKASGSRELKVNYPEAHWCCTMRGAEGLAWGSEATAIVRGGRIMLAQYRSANVRLQTPSGVVAFEERSGYPFGGPVEIRFTQVPHEKIALAFFSPSYLDDVGIVWNGTPVTAETADGFREVRAAFKPGDRLTFSYVPRSYSLGPQCAENVEAGLERRMRGPLVLGRGSDGAFKPIHHVMDEAVWDEGSPGPTILFDIIRADN